MAPSLAADLRLALDRVAFASSLGLDPDPWQERLLRSTSQRVLLDCSRQSGKSTMSGVIALHRALYFPGSLVLCLAPSERQSKELFAKVSDSYRRLRGTPAPASAGAVAGLVAPAGGSALVSVVGLAGPTARADGLQVRQQGHRLRPRAYPRPSPRRRRIGHRPTSRYRPVPSVTMVTRGETGPYPPDAVFLAKVFCGATARGSQFVMVRRRERAGPLQIWCAARPERRRGTDPRGARVRSRS